MNSVEGKLSQQLAELKGIAYVEAAAGCGKTFKIAEAISFASSGPQLVLTHTHAGVASLRKKLRDLGVSCKYYYVDTIDGWCQRLSAAFPSVSGFKDDCNWPEMRQATINVLKHPFISKLILETYQGLYVDEYQDCNLLQHQIILNLAEIMPCRIFGDPLQSIFTFDKEAPAISWKNDVVGKIPKLAELTTPWRWKLQGGNEKLGNWITTIRQKLLQNESINISGAPISHFENSFPEKLRVCKNHLGEKGTVVAITKLPNDGRFLAGRLGGTYQSMEEMECKRLISFASKFSKSTGAMRALVLIDFVEECFSNTSTIFKQIKGNLEKGKSIISRSEKQDIQKACEAIQLLLENDSLEILLPVLKMIETIKTINLYSKELWGEAKKMVDAYNSNQHENLIDAAKEARAQTRIFGRKPEYRTVSTILLIKGLEFDHAIVLIPDDLNANELYVALSRARKSVAVLSNNNQLPLI